MNLRSQSDLTRSDSELVLRKRLKLLASYSNNRNIKLAGVAYCLVS
jgi:hypothetical protein